MQGSITLPAEVTDMIHVLECHDNTFTKSKTPKDLVQ